jgi:hypothetical protein
MILLAATANDFSVIGCSFHGGIGVAVTCLRTQAVTKGLRIQGCSFDCASSFVSSGNVRILHACTQVNVSDNTWNNSLALSQFCIQFDLASSGVCTRNLMRVLADNVASDQGISIGATCVIGFNQNYVTDEGGASGVLTPAACVT